MSRPTTIFETVHGSRAYGLARAGSDLDVKGVVVGPKAWYLGFRGGPEQIELGTGTNDGAAAAKDHVAFELRKLLRLLANANPTVLELLFVDPALHRVRTPEGELLLDARRGFLTRQVGESFGGYALGQLRRIQTHRKWLLAPPTEAPTRAAFGLRERPAIPKDQLGAAETLLARGAFDDASFEGVGFLELLAREKRFEAAKKQWQQYQHWRRERNEARAALEAKHGYDTKHAMHLVRLQRMGLEILEQGEVIVTRPDREELLAIRDGAWPYERLLEEAERMATRIRAATEQSALPAQVDEDAVEALGITIVERVLFDRS